MKIIYAKQDLIPCKYHKSIFLAGPTVRAPKNWIEAVKMFPRPKSWRFEAIELLRKYDFDGIVLAPEDEDGKFKGNYDDQIEWEDNALYLATTIMFWVPRKIKNMPGLTTNVEFGRWMDSGKVVLGIPPNAEKCKYLTWYADKLDIPFSTTLDQCVRDAMNLKKYNLY